ncbi:hypothetical protein MAR_035175, partial [Mya arenaria]
MKFMIYVSILRLNFKTEVEILCVLFQEDKSVYGACIVVVCIVIQLNILIIFVMCKLIIQENNNWSMFA